MILDVKIPDQWSSLTPSQLTTLVRLLAKCDVETAKSLFLYHILSEQNIILHCHPTEGYCCKMGKRNIRISLSQLSAVREKLAFIDRPDAVRPDTMHGRKAVHPLLQEDFTFFEYLRVENFYQAFLYTKSPDYLRHAAGYLYRSDDKKDMPRLTEEQQTAIILWIVGVKTRLAQVFPHFFTPTGGTAASPNDSMESTDAQIRALTGGDVTKEQQVLDTQCWRALSELNAKAREAEELRQKMRK